jgi:hypothetical protein
MNIEISAGDPRSCGQNCYMSDADTTSCTSCDIVEHCDGIDGMCKTEDCASCAPTNISNYTYICSDCNIPSHYEVGRCILKESIDRNQLDRCTLYHLFVLTLRL